MVKLVLAQLLPELVLDLFVTYVEVQGGLQRVHASVWSWSTGADPSSRAWAARRGALVKGLTLKAFYTIACVAIVLAARLP